MNRLKNDITPLDRTVVISNSTVVIGNSAGGDVAASTQTEQQLDCNERELLRIFNSLPIRLKVEFFQGALDLEDRHLNKIKKAPPVLEPRERL